MKRKKIDFGMDNRPLCHIKCTKNDNTGEAPTGNKNKDS